MQAIIDSALQAFEAGRYEQAISLFREVLRIEPANVQARTLLDHAQQAILRRQTDEKPVGTRLFFSYVLAYARQTHHVLGFKVGDDLFEISDALYIKHISTKLTRLDPHVVFPDPKLPPHLQSAQLVPVNPSVDGEALFRINNKLLGWEELYRDIRSVIPLLEVPPDGSFRTRILDHGAVQERRLAEAIARHPELTLGQALLADEACTFQDLLEARLGSMCVLRPVHQHAQHVGRILLEVGALVPEALEIAIQAQLSKRTSLADQLRGGIDATVMLEALRLQKALPEQAPEIDQVGEILVKMGALTRTEQVQALDVQTESAQMFGAILREQNMVSEDLLQKALRRQKVKRQLRWDGVVRLGAVMADRRLLSPEQLEAALCAQVRDPRPLAEVALSLGCCTPEDAIDAIAEQEARLEALTEKRMAAPAAKGKSAAPAPASGRKAPPARRSTGKLQALPEDRPKTKKPFPFKMWLGLGGVFMGLSLMGLAGYLVVGSLKKSAPVMGALPLSSSRRPTAGSMPTTTQDVIRTAEETQPDPRHVEAYREVFLDSAQQMARKNSANIDVNAMIAKIDKGQGNPLQDGYLGAYKQVLPANLEQAAKQAAGQPAVFDDARRQALLHPPAIDETPPAPALSTGAAHQFEQEGDRQLAVGHAGAAVSAYSQAIKTAPAQPSLWRKLGDSQQAAGQPAQAVQSLDQAAKLAPRDGGTLAALGRARQARGDVQGALQVQQQAVKVAPSDPSVHNQLGVTLRAAGRNDDARAAFEAALKLDPDNPNLHFNLAGVLERRDEGAARGHYAEAVLGFGHQVLSRLAYGRALREQHDGVGAMRNYRAALRASTLQADAALALGRLAGAQKDYAAARGAFGQSRAAYRMNAVAENEIGLVHQDLGAKTEAMQDWILASRMAPDYAPPLYYLGRLAVAQGKNGEARTFYARAIAADPKDALAQAAQRELGKL